MAKIVKKYDTSELRSLIKEKGWRSYASFSKAVSEDCGVKCDTIITNLNGYYKPDEKRIKSIAKILEIPVSDIKKYYGISNKEKSFKNSTININIEAIDKAIKESNIPRSHIFSSLNIGYSTIGYWRTFKRANIDAIRRLADFFKVDIHEFVTDPIEEEKSTEVDQKVSGISLTPIGDTLNVHELFEIINSNIMAVANALSDYIESQNDKNDEFIKAINELNINNTAKIVSIIGEITNSQNKSDKKQQDKITKPIAVTNEEVSKLSSSYKEEDSYEIYRNKINRMISIISAYTGFTRNQLLHDFYSTMTNVYGCVYDQLKKEFHSRYKYNETSSMELIYFNEIFRQIFYNIISDEMVKSHNDNIAS